MQPDYGQPLQPGQYQQPVAASQVKKTHSSLILLIMLAVFVILFIIAAIIGVTTSSKYGDLKKNFDEKVSVASEKAVSEAETKQTAEFEEKLKSPLTEYQGPAPYGSVNVKYPKTWSAFVTEDAKSTSPINGYFHPGFVPGINSGTAFALHMEVLESDYDQQLKKFDNASKQNKVKVTPITIQDIAGARIEGEFERERKGTVVLFPLRDKTLKLTSESTAFTSDFNDIILKNLTFVP